MPKVASNMFPFLNTMSRGYRGLVFEMQLGNDFYNVSLAGPRIPCDSGSHKGNAQRYTLADNLVTNLHFTVLRICCRILPLCDRNRTHLYLADLFRFRRFLCHLIASFRGPVDGNCI
jgi:hypothetical protein